MKERLIIDEKETEKYLLKLQKQIHKNPILTNYPAYKTIEIKSNGHRNVRANRKKVLTDKEALEKLEYRHNDTRLNNL